MSLKDSLTLSPLTVRKAPLSRPRMASSSDPRLQKSATSHLQAPGRADGGALIEHREVQFFDPIEDFGVQGESRGDARSRPRMQQVDAVAGEFVNSPGFRVLLFQGATYSGIG